MGGWLELEPVAELLLTSGAVAAAASPPPLHATTSSAEVLDCGLQAAVGVLQP